MKKHEDIATGIVGLIVFILLIAVSYAASWVWVNFLIWLICKCFGWHYTFLVGTGIWLILRILKSVFHKGNTTNNYYNNRRF